MDEMENELLKHHVPLETLPSNPLWSQNSCDYAQKTFHVFSLSMMNPACDQSSISTAENHLPVSYFNDGKSVHAGPNPSQTKFPLKGCELESKCKRFGKRILDLELPPDEYIDSEEDESLQKLPEVSGYPPKRISEVLHKSYQQPYHGSDGFNSVEQVDKMTPRSISFKKKFLADLNEPIKFEEESDSMSIHVADLNEPYHGSDSFNSVFQVDNVTPSLISFKKKGLADLNEPIKLEEESDSMSIHMADLNEPTEHEEEAAPMSKFLADLNEPIKLEEEAASMSSVFPSPANDHRKFPCQDLSQKSNSGFQVFSMDLVQNTKTRRDLETCSDGLHPETSKMQECPSYGNEAGQYGSNIASLSPGFSEEGSTSLEDVELKQTHELPRSYIMDQSKRKLCSEGLQSLQGELSSNSYPERVSNSNVGTSCQLSSQTDVGNSEGSSVSSWRKHVRDVLRNPIAVQALPCFNTTPPLSKSSKSSIASPSLSCKRRLHGNKLKSGPKFDGTSFNLGSFCNGSHSEYKTSESHQPSISIDGPDCSNSDDLVSEHHGPTKFIRISMDVKHAKYVNSDFTSQICSLGGEKKLEDSPWGLPWLKTKSVCKRKRGKRSELSTQMESVSKQANSSCILDVELKKAEASNNPSGNSLLGFHGYKNPHMSNGQSSSPSPAKSYQNPSEDGDIENIEKDRIIDINLDYDPATMLREQLISNDNVAGMNFNKKFSDFRVGIDLNSNIDEHVCFPAPSLSAELDLEAPARPENKKRSPLRGESDENPVETPFQISGKEDEDLQEALVGNPAEAIEPEQEGEDVQEELVRTAAKAIVSISSSTFGTCSEIAACEPSEPCWSDDLYWFARIVSLAVDDPDSEFGVALDCKNSDDNHECLANGLDYFEAMTLKLTETKVEEQWCKSNGQKDQKEEETGATSLPIQTRRGRMRRGRQQRKDFRNEIIPSLASLSRYELTEDLRTIEGLIEVSNNGPGTSSTRNVGRNASARGRRRSCNSTSNVKENNICSLLKLHANCREKGTEDRGLIGWGKITRQRRGPRCPASNGRLIQGQVH